ncbi:F-box protein CPR1-like [Henckelia pumila]|uniref:F-box protein CPR1-like n=1 Tax=Henckelia pumila TaxID=405737 RepID=UPI003C6DC304
MCTISPSLLNLPSEIIINILSRIRIKTILSCKCVCKQLLHLLSTPHFAESHLPFSTPGLLIFQSGTNHNLCQIFEYEDGTQQSSLKSTLPRIEGFVEHPDTWEYGFGVSKITGQYKVVRNVHRNSNETEPWRSCGTIQNHECLVYTLGTRSWRRLQPGPPFGHYELSRSLFLNGNLHGVVQNHCGSDERFITCFDLESESFKPFPTFPPPPVPPVVGTLGILDDCLCHVDIRSEENEITAIWVMKEYGVEKSWTEILVIEQVEEFPSSYSDLVYPIKAFKNGDILLDSNNCNLFYYSSKAKTCEDVDVIGIQNEGGWIAAIPHSLSFLSLKKFNGEKGHLVWRGNP